MFSNTKQNFNPIHGTLSNGALFVRLALDTSETKVEKLLINIWKIPKPRLIMSIIGGQKYFTLSDRLETNFINGIIHVALKSDAWLMTNGYNVGIVQLVGQAINKVKLTNPKKKLTAIGVCKWGSVQDVEEITDSENKKKQKKNDTSNTNDNEEKIHKRESGQRDLEMNHSHYLMLDDGRLRYYDIEDYRTRLCVQLAKLRHEINFSTPVVTIVVEGGRETIKNVYHDLRANIPVVIIDGSGRVADFFKRWLLYTKEFDDNSKDSDIAYEIDQIDNVTPVITVPPLTSNQNDVNNSKPSDAKYVQSQSEEFRNPLQNMFSKYVKQLQTDLSVIMTHDDDSNKKKRKAPSSNSSNDRLSTKLITTLKQVMYCLQPAVRSGITVFNLNSDDNLSETIFRSICKARQKNFNKNENDENNATEENQGKLEILPNLQDRELQSSVRQNIHKKDRRTQRSQLLRLAMDWNCIHVAKELILQNSLNNILNKEQDFIYALTEDLPTFVYEFLKLGIDPSEIFFPDDEFFKGKTRYKKFIECFYKIEIVNRDTTHLSWFIESHSDSIEKHITTTDELNSVLATLVGDYMSNLYFDSNEQEKMYRSLWGLDKENDELKQSNNRGTGSDDNLADGEKRQIIQDYIMRDLFLWSILMNHIDMAKVLLCYVKYRICPALIATKILKEYHRKAPYGELKENYMKNADYFQQYAIDCITQCEKNDSDQACQIVLQRIELYGNVTCLQVAADAEDKLFIATSCCVQAMNNIWYDKIHAKQSRKRNYFFMGMGFFSSGLLAPFTVTYRTCPKVYYCFFLLLFSYTLLFDFQRPTNENPSIHWTEILTIILVSCMLIEEIHYFACLDNLSLAGKCISYFRNRFKIMTIVGVSLFYIGLILRFTHASTDDEFTAARVVMAIDLEIWYLRSLSFIIVVQYLGPHLVAIGKMLKDLAFFMCIIFIVMAGYGVASRSMVYYPNSDKFNQTNFSTAFDGRSIFRQIVYPVYYLMYGQFGNELSNLDAYPDAGWSISTHVLLAAHMLLVNILLINLLIAMFSKRFDQVHNDTQSIWHSQQYLFTREYFTRSPFFPPISLIYDIYHLCRITIFAIRRVIKKSADRRAKVFKIIPINKSFIKDWYEFEGASTYEYAHTEAKTSKTTSMISTKGSDLNKIEKRENINDNKDDSNNSINNVEQIRNDLAKLNQSFEESKQQIQEELAKLNQSFEEIKKYLKK
ncbi:unnamed protein product [Rotaria sp. Silwood1]|nr:unnamed protein product [Rotaria sp. Silwood1]